MRVRKYLAGDFDQIEAWGAQWGAEYNEDQFPLTGFIVDGVAAYFLYQTDSSVCWMENLITNRSLSDSVKNQAINLLIDAAIKTARELGFTVAYATTNVVSMAKRAKEHGAIVRPGQVLLMKDLTTRTQ